jgi:hypothetical protein
MQSKWGVFTLLYAPESHVAPCDEKGRVLSPHLLRHDCPCCPALKFPDEVGSAEALVVHNELTIH